MRQLEFVTVCLGYLARMFPDMEKRFASEEYIELWVQRFGHLEHDVWKRAVDAYASDNHFPPTINKLMEYVPESVRKPVPVAPERTDRTWDAMTPAQQEAMRAANLRQLREVYAVINRREWGMDTSGDD